MASKLRDTKAAPGYTAKLIIRLINRVGEVVNNDPDMSGRLKVVFFPDFNVKNAKDCQVNINSSIDSSFLSA
jgi:glucan phosphorylase